VSIIRDRESGASARTSAANILLDRAWGKPTQSVDANVNGSMAVYVVTGVPRSDSISKDISRSRPTSLTGH
jgi:hypothetical protein